MDKASELLQIRIVVLSYELKRSIVHQVHQSARIVHDRFSLSPGNGSRKESADLNVFPTGVPVGNTDGILHYEIRMIEPDELFIEESFELGVMGKHGANIVK